VLPKAALASLYITTSLGHSCPLQITKIVFKALSDSVKKIKARQCQNVAMQKAIDAYHQEQERQRKIKKGCM